MESHRQQIELLNIARFEALRSRLPEKIFSSLLESFAHSAPMYIQVIVETATRAETDPLKRAVHELRGFASNFGTPRIEHLALQIEELNGSQNNASIIVVAQQLARAIEDTWIAIEQHLLSIGRPAVR